MATLPEQLSPFTLLRRENVTAEEEKKNGLSIFRFHIHGKGYFEAEFRSQKDSPSPLAIELRLEERARARLKIIHRGQKDSLFRCRTLQKHLGDYSASTVEIKCVCEDDAQLDYVGKIEVPENIRGVQAIQRNKNLVFSEKVCIHTEPAMDVRSKDVECIHGAATGGIDGEILHYFSLRGVEKSLAQELYIAGFLG
ncbi:MAG: SufD family Fe-S cluster assembly protein [Puniceicoccales bacterium]|jgi:Fe-S cluster assembly scaffold protein SufB|nr:SufD family Fe-S cluster assembly protein [Puniceicoccales bacterium]